MPDCARLSVHAGKKNDVYKISKWQPTSRRNAASDARRSGDAPHDALKQRDLFEFVPYVLANMLAPLKMQYKLVQGSIIPSF
jgi:hypothetical protein